MNTLLAPAKLTWSLRVLGRREDGYHLLDAEMQTLDLADRITVTPAAKTVMSVSGAFVDGVPLDASNLVLRALAATHRTARVHLDKQIPSGGGLGGGSADAAAILRWAGVEDPDVAVGLGADVPFCVSGGRARVAGVGDIVEPLPHVERTVTLVVPPVRVSTAAVYVAWDELGGPSADGPNDLEPAAIRVEPQLARWRDRVGELAGTGPVLAGSGATWFVEGDLGAALAGLEGAAVIVARTTPSR